MSNQLQREHLNRTITTKQTSQMGARKGNRAAFNGSAWLQVALVCATISLLSFQANHVRAQPPQNVINFNFRSAPTSSPLATAAASAAAAAALGGLDLTVGSSSIKELGLAVDSSVGKQAPTTTSPQAKVQVIHTINRSTSIKPSVVVSLSQSSSLTSASGSHRHSNKKIDPSDKLHKFDLYIDPVCDQIAKLTEKQVNKVYAQLRQFSQSTNNALAKCLTGMRVDIMLQSNQQQLRQSRDSLSNFCSARVLTNEPYKQFTSCATSSWSARVDADLDRALKDRLHANRTRSKSGLTPSEISLIDDIVAHLHEDQAQEIAAELAKEQQTVVNVSSSPLATGDKGAAASHPAVIGKITLAATPAPAPSTTATGGGDGGGGIGKGERGANTLVIQLAANQQQQQHHHHQISPAPGKHASGLGHGGTIPPLVVKPAGVVSSTSQPVKQLPPSPTVLMERFNGQEKQIVLAKSQQEISTKQTSLATTLTSQNNIRIAIITTTPAPHPIITISHHPNSSSLANLTPSPINSNKGAQHNTSQPLQVHGSGGSLMKLLEHSNNSITLTVNDNKLKPAATTKTPVLLLVAEKSPIKPPPPASTPKPLDIIIKHQAAAQNASQVLIVPAANNQTNKIVPVPLFSATPTSAPLPPVVIPPPPTMTTTTTTTTVVSPVNNQPNLAIPPASSAATAPAVAQPVQPLQPAQPANPVAPAQTLAPLAPLTPAPPPPAAATAVASGPPVPISPLSSAVSAATNPVPQVSLASPPLPAPQTAVNVAVGAPTSAAVTSQAVLPPVAPLSGSPSQATVIPLIATTAAPAVSPLANILLNSINLTTKRPSNSSAEQAPAKPIQASAISANATVASAAAPKQAYPAVLNDALDHPELASLSVSASASSGSAVSAATLATQPKATTGKFVEPAIMKNVDKALEAIEHPDHSNSTLIEKSSSSKSTVINVIVSGSSTTTTKKPETTSTTTTTTTTTATPTETIIITRVKATQKPKSAEKSGDEAKEDEEKEEEKKKKKKKSEASGGEHELLRLRNNADSSTSVHDVIVVGEHVEGDDLLHDYEDHSDHHESHSSSETGAQKSEKHNEHEHEHHDEAKKSLKIEHHDEKQSKSQNEHDDHEHLLKGLLVGDVIHVEAGELEGGSD